MELLKDYFSGDEGLKRSNAFLKFANMLVSDPHLHHHGHNNGWTGCMSAQIPNDNCSPVDYWQFLMSSADNMDPPSEQKQKPQAATTKKVKKSEKKSPEK
jgi:hypothetical protein